MVDVGDSFSAIATSKRFGAVELNFWGKVFLTGRPPNAKEIVKFTHILGYPV
jgi:hypothetical protein